MAYLGNVVPANFQAPPAVVRFNGDGSDTTFALGRTIGSVQEILVSVDGVVQDSAAYTVPDGSTLTFTAAPSSGTPYVIYTAASSTTTVVLGLILTNLNTSQVTTTVRLVSDTANRAVTNNTANGTSLLVKDAPIPVGGSLEILTGSKVILETTDQLTVDCSVADKLSGTLSVMEIT